MEKMLDAGFCLPAIGFAYHSTCLRHELRPNVAHGRGQAGRAGMLVVKSYYPYFIQHPASSICSL
jgi:hypothetical protein